MKAAMWILGSVLIVGCITVNVHFPEGAVQKAADDYVRELYKAKAEQEAKPKDTSWNWQAPNSLALVARLFLDQANAKDFSLDSPEIKSIQKSQSGRISKIDKLKKEGIIGETFNGRLQIQKRKKWKPLKMRMAKKLVEAENADRDKLYSAVLRKNKMSSNFLPKVQEKFRKSFQNVSPSGTWVEAAQGSWSQKP